MARRGRKRRLGIGDEYWALIRSGVGTVEACRAVGVGRKTGYRWRRETGGLPPDRLDQAAHSDRFLSRLERERISTLRSRGMGVREIARRIGRSPSTVSRELRRNTARHDVGGYDPVLAHARARARARRPKSGRLLSDTGLRREVADKLDQEWIPEQIAAHLRRAFPDQPAWHVCHETIYQALYDPSRSGLSRTLTRKLRTGRPIRKRRRRTDQRSPRFLRPGRLISERPDIAGERGRIGDWEGDLILGRGNKSAIGTLVDRASRYVVLLHLPGRHDAESLTEQMHLQLPEIPALARRTLTWDQGSEMALHDQIASLFTDGVFFAEPGSPWQRGTNENTNGLLRQYFPKGSDLSSHGRNDLTAIANRLNRRPRKTLNWATPQAQFTTQMARSNQPLLRCLRPHEYGVPRYSAAASTIPPWPPPY